ncbi:MAG: hypothetical protein O6826_10350, partial [Acidobacteria bacterium]|nr:hypothetical protein [Acidobacteriota bacterium]
KYRNRMDLFRKVLEARSSLLERFVHENKLEELREILLRIRALCPHVEDESSDVKKGSDLRSKQVRKLEIYLRKLVKRVKDLQTVAPVKYAEEFEVTAEALERLRRILLTQLLGYSFSKSGITDSSRTWALQAKRLLDIFAPPGSTQTLIRVDPGNGRASQTSRRS